MEGAARPPPLVLSRTSAVSTAASGAPASSRTSADCERSERRQSGRYPPTRGHPSSRPREAPCAVDGVGEGRDTAGPGHQQPEDRRHAGAARAARRCGDRRDRVKRGGPQIIPRPDGALAGGPAPWAGLSELQRRITFDRLRDVLTGRTGSPSFVELEPDHALGASAVLAPFYEDGGELFVVLTRRGWGLRSHTGEVSFPGGRRDRG